MSQTPAILDEILQERRRQDEEWGGAAHDDGHTFEDWMQIILQEAGEASDFVEQLKIKSDSRYLAMEYRIELLHVAAVAVAAIEALDRRMR